MEFRHLANAGFFLGFGKSNIIVDGLHRGNMNGYPQVDDKLWRKMKNELAMPELLFFTHCHPDHFSREMLVEAQGVWKNADVITPETIGSGCMVMTGDRGRIGLESGSVEYFLLPHEGEEYRSVSHYGLLVRGEGMRLFAAGDCHVGAAEIEQLPELRNIDVAVLSFPWISLRAGRRIIDEVLRPQILLINHFPEADADVFSYYSAAKTAAEKYYPKTKVRFLTEPMQRFVI